MRTFVTGLGCISAVGSNVDQNAESIFSGNDGLRDDQRFNYQRKKLIVGNVTQSNEELAEGLNQSSQRKLSRTALLGMTALSEAMQGHELSNHIKTGFINGTSVGGMDLSEQFYKKYKKGENSDPSVLLQHDCGTITNLIAEQLGNLDFITTISTACSSAANAIIFGQELIEAGYLDRVIVGGTDALSDFTISGFDSLGLLDEDKCRPFDNSRNGLNLGEGSAYLVLESEQCIQNTGNTPIASVLGGANKNDAYHQTASSPGAVGATLAMKEALRKSEVQASDIDYINMHGTATKNNDLVESIAVQNIFGESIPPFSSTKSLTGHTLAPCGSIEAIYSILAMQENKVPPSLRFSNAIEETRLTPTTSAINHTIDIVLSNSFGFGGNSSSIILSSI